jgi:hypothetical protein
MSYQAKESTTCFAERASSGISFVWNRTYIAKSLASFLPVDIDNVVALNAEDESQAKDILKAWDDRLDEEKFLRSDAE